MSAELAAYSLTVGAVASQGRDESGLPARAVQVLDQRDAEHLTQFGHLPGAPGCTLPSRGDALGSALAGVRAEQRGAMLGTGTSQDAADELNRRGPWLNVEVIGDDPEVVRARGKLAAELAALHARAMTR